MLSIVLIGLAIALARGYGYDYEERKETFEPYSWHLAMNLNPEDGHVMDYSTGWDEEAFIGTYAEALKKDFLNRVVWRQGEWKYIAIVRHQAGEVDAVKVFKFQPKQWDWSLLEMFQNYLATVVTEGGPLQESISANADNLEDDPIFSVGGDVAINWNNDDNGHRLVLTGGILAKLGEKFNRGDRDLFMGSSSIDVDTSDKTRGFGSDFYLDESGRSLEDHKWGHEISNQVESDNYWQGSDNGEAFGQKGPVYGNYAIYVSQEADRFPKPGYKLKLKVDMKSSKTLLQEL